MRCFILLKYIASKDNIKRYEDVNSNHSISVVPIRAFHPKPVVLEFKNNDWCQYCYLDRKVR